MTEQYTAGPWCIAYDDANGQAVISGEHTEVATCWHHCVGSLEKQMRANARLIAAAPDLLAALVDTVDLAHTLATMRGCEYEGDIGADLLPARAAIAKATA